MSDEPPSSKLQVQIDDDVAQGVYSNLVLLNHTENEFVLDFKASGRAVVIATHSFATGLAAADRVAILAGGRILADQPCADQPWEVIRDLYDSLVDGGEAMPREAMS